MRRMHRDKAKLIEAFFTEHADDADFGHDSHAPFLVIGPGDDVSPIIFTTKPSPVAAAICQSEPCKEFGMIGRYGLPALKDAQWIRGVAAARKLLFLGDLDPVDLLVFAWLRLSLPSNSVAFLGTSDPYLAALQASLPESFLMSCSPSERAGLALVHEVFPDFCETIGPGCAELVDSGRKIELDAIVSALGTPVPILLPAIAGRG
jgi:hypothetical protein